MTYLLPFALLSLFTAFKLKMGGVQIRPFDAIVVVMIAWTFLHTVSMKRVRMNGFLVLLPFFAWHVLSAFIYGAENGIREGLQVSLMVAFAGVLMLSVNRIDYRTAAKVMIAGLVVVLLYNIIWHVSQGMWTGWKRLNNPKAIFGYLPMALGCLVLFAAPAQRRFYWLLWGGLLVILLLSGERKSLIIYGVISAMFMARGRALAALPFLGAGVLGLFLIINIFAAQDFTKQLRTMTNPFTSAGSEATVARGITPESLSNAQRAFAFDMASSYFKQNPIMGTGTNSYQNLIASRFAYLPEYMLLGVHGEFLRIAAENGLIGLLFYLAIWVVAIVRLRRVLHSFQRRGLISRLQEAMTPFVLLTSPLLYLALDASGTPSFAVLIIVSFLPDLTHWVLSQRAARALASAEPPVNSQKPFADGRFVVG